MNDFFQSSSAVGSPTDDDITIATLEAKLAAMTETLAEVADRFQALIFDEHRKVKELERELEGLRIALDGTSAQRNWLNLKLDETHLHRCYSCEATVTPKTTEKQVAERAKLAEEVREACAKQAECQPRTCTGCRACDAGEDVRALDLSEIVRGTR